MNAGRQAGGDGADSVFGAADPRPFHADDGSILHEVQVLEPSPTLVVQRASGAAFGTDQTLVPAFHFDDDFDGLRPSDDFLHLPRRLQAQEFGDEFPGHHHSVGTRFVAEGGAAALGIAARVSAGMGRANSR